MQKQAEMPASITGLVTTTTWHIDLVFQIVVNDEQCPHRLANMLDWTISITCLVDDTWRRPSTGIGQLSVLVALLVAVFFLCSSFVSGFSV